MDTLTSKQRKLLQLLSAQNDYLRGQDAAAKLGVTDRTIRTDVAQMEPTLAAIGAQIESVRGKGYLLRASDPAALRQLLYGDGSLVSQEDRLHVILERLIFSDSPIALGDLQDELYISHTTLENDLRRIRSRFCDAPPYANLIRCENRISLQETETRKRFLLRILYTEDWDYNSDDGLKHRKTFLSSKHFDLISDTVKTTLRRYGITVNDHGLVNFVFAVAIAHFRLSTGFPIQSAEPTQNASVQSAVERICDELEAPLHIVFPPIERQHLSALLAQEHLFSLQSTSWSELTNLVDTPVLVLLDQYLEQIQREYGLELLDDDTLRCQLAICLHTARRMPYCGHNELAALLRASDPYLFDLAARIAPMFQQAFAVQLHEQELGEIGGYLAAAIERRAVAFRRIRVALASHCSYSTSSYIMARLNAFFGNRIDLRGPFSVYDRQALLHSGCQLILTTTRADLIRSETQRTYPISIALPEKEILGLHALLQELRGERLYGVPRIRTDRFFDPKFFNLHSSAAGRGVLLRQMCNRLEEEDVVTPEFYEDVLRREALSSTAFDPGFATPHSITVPAKRTVISVALLEKPILWGETRVSYVCLIALAPNDRRDLFRIYNDLRTRFENHSAWKFLSEVQTFEDFLRLV